MACASGHADRVSLMRASSISPSSRRVSSSITGRRLPVISPGSGMESVLIATRTRALVCAYCWMTVSLKANPPSRHPPVAIIPICSASERERNQSFSPSTVISRKPTQRPINVSSIAPPCHGVSIELFRAPRELRRFFAAPPFGGWHGGTPNADRE